MALAIGALLAAGCGARGLPPVAVPATGDLDPQVRHHLEREVARVRKNPSSAERHGLLGFAYYVNGCYQEARRSLDQALKLDPNHVASCLYRALVLRDLGEQAEARRQLEQLMAKSPDLAGVLDAYGQLVLSEGELPAARAAFEAVVRLAPRESNGYEGLAGVLLRQHEAAAAVEVLKRGLSQPNPNPRLRHVLSIAERMLAGGGAPPAQALAPAKIASRLPDGWAENFYEHAMGVADQIERANLFRQANRLPEAIRVLQETLSFHGGNYEVLNNLAVLQIEAGEFAGATALLDRADQVASGRYETALTRAFLAQRRGNSPDVHRYAQLASQLAPEQSRPHKLRGEAFMKDGDFSAAYDSLRQAHALGDVDYQLQLKIGSVCMSLGKLGEARQSFEAAVALNATDPLAFLCLFEACMKIGDERSAARALDEARRLAPEDPRVRKAVEWIQKNRL